MVHIKTTDTGGAVAAVDVTNCFTSTYNRYYVAFDLIGSTTNQELKFRFLDNTTPYTTGNHRVQQFYAASTTISGFRNNTYAYWSIGQVNQTYRQYGELFLVNPTEALRPTGISKYIEDINGNIIFVSYAMSVDTTTSFSGLQIYAQSGNINGSISVYGYKE